MKVLTDLISPYMKLKPVASFVQRVKKAALKVVVGNPHDAVQLLPALVELLVEAGHGAQLIKTSGQNVLTSTEGILRAEWVGAQKRKPAADRVPFDAEMAMAKYPEIDPTAQYILGWHFAPNTSMAVIDKLHAVSFADAAHMSVRLCFRFIELHQVRT